MKGKYKILVSDPWDYKNAQGENLIFGEIVRVISIRCIIFKSDTSLEFDGNYGKILILSSRYKENKVSEDLDGLSINAGLLLEDYHESYNEEELKSLSKFVVIGRLEKY